MIINQISYKKKFVDSSVTSKDILYNKIAYGATGKILGNAPMTIDNIMENEIFITSTVSSAHVNSMCYGDGKFVCVLSNGTTNIAEYSTDGITWIQTFLPTTAYWNYICYGNGKFVALPYADYTTSQVTTNKAAYSEDGINWTQITMPTSAYWFRICYGNDKFVAVSGGKALVDIAVYKEDFTSETLTLT